MKTDYFRHKMTIFKLIVPIALRISFIIPLNYFQGKLLFFKYLYNSIDNSD